MHGFYAQMTKKAEKPLHKTFLYKLWWSWCIIKFVRLAKLQFAGDFLPFTFCKVWWNWPLVGKASWENDMSIAPKAKMDLTNSKIWPTQNGLSCSFLQVEWTKFRLEFMCVWISVRQVQIGEKWNIGASPDYFSVKLGVGREAPPHPTPGKKVSEGSTREY